MSVRDVVRRHWERETALLTRYIRLQESQRDAIARRDLDYLQRIIASGTEILSKVEALRQVDLPGLTTDERPDDVRALYDTARVLHRENRILLSELMDATGQELADFNVPRQRRSVFSGTETGGGLVDMHF